MVMEVEKIWKKSKISILYIHINDNRTGEDRTSYLIISYLNFLQKQIQSIIRNIVDIKEKIERETRSEFRAYTIITALSFFKMSVPSKSGGSAIIVSIWRDNGDYHPHPLEDTHAS